MVFPSWIQPRTFIPCDATPRSSDPLFVLPSVITKRTCGLPAGLHPEQKNSWSASLRALSVLVLPVKIKRKQHLLKCSRAADFYEPRNSLKPRFN